MPDLDPYNSTSGLGAERQAGFYKWIDDGCPEVGSARPSWPGREDATDAAVMHLARRVKEMREAHQPTDQNEETR